MPEQQHFLARFYLEGFAIAEGSQAGSCWVFEPGRGIRLTGPRGIAKRPDYFRLAWHGNPRAMEGLFGRVEAEAAPVVREILRQPAVPQGDGRQWLIVFVGIHLLRVPHMRDAVNDFSSRVCNSILAAYAQRAEGLWNMPADAAEGAGQYDFRHAENGEASVLIQALPSVIRVLDDMKMHIAVPPPGSAFITGDRPVSTFAPGHGGWSTGLAMPRVEVVFPLGSQVCLVFNWDGPGGLLQFSEEQVNQVNYRTTTYSRQLLVGSDKALIQDLRARQTSGSSATGHAGPGPRGT